MEQAQRQFLQRYRDYLETVEEGIGSVAYFYREGFEENGDRLLEQMLDGFEGSMTMDYIFRQKAESGEEMETFHQKIEEARHIPDFVNVEEKIRTLTTDFNPAFQRWKVIVENVQNEEDSSASN